MDLKKEILNFIKLDPLDLKGKSNKILDKGKEYIKKPEGKAALGGAGVAAMTTTSFGVAGKLSILGATLGPMVFLNGAWVAVPAAAVGAHYITKAIKYKRQNDKLLQNLKENQDLIDNDEFFIRFEELQYTQIKDVVGVEDHRKLFLDTIDNAKENIIVYSGWLTSFSVNKEFQNKLKSALQRGVNFYLGFGYESSRDQDNNLNKKIIADAVRDLRELQQWSANIKSKGKLYLLKFPNHKKILSCDYKYVVIGSFNWLSNISGKNQEMSVQLFAKKYVKEKVNMFIHEFNDPKNPISRREFLNQFGNFTDYPS